MLGVCVITLLLHLYLFPWVIFGPGLCDDGSGRACFPLSLLVPWYSGFLVMLVVSLCSVLVVWFRLLVIGFGVSASGAFLFPFWLGVWLISSPTCSAISMVSLYLGVLCRSASAMIIWSVFRALKVGLAVRPLSLLWPMVCRVLVSVGSPSCAFPVCLSNALKILLNVSPLWRGVVVLCGCSCVPAFK